MIFLQNCRKLYDFLAKLLKNLIHLYQAATKAKKSFSVLSLTGCLRQVFIVFPELINIFVYADPPPPLPIQTKQKLASLW